MAFLSPHLFRVPVFLGQGKDLRAWGRGCRQHGGAGEGLALGLAQVQAPRQNNLGHSLYLWAQTFSSALCGALLVPGTQRCRSCWTKCQFWRARTSFHLTAGKSGEEVGGQGFLAVPWPLVS